MIFDNIKNIDKYDFAPAICAGFDFILNNNLKDLPAGKYEIYDGIFANIQTLEAKSPELAKFEAHREYIDIQFIISGKERMDFANIENFDTEIPYDEQKDVEFLKLNENALPFSSAYLKENDFAIFYPQDAHAPMLSTDGKNSQIKKVIVKISVNL